MPNAQAKLGSSQCLDKPSAGGRPELLAQEQEEFIIQMLTPCEIWGAGLQRRRMVDDAPLQTPQKPQVGEMSWDGDRSVGW